MAPRTVSLPRSFNMRDSVGSPSFLMSHQSTLPSVDTDMASVPVLDCSQAKSYTGSLQQRRRQVNKHNVVLVWEQPFSNKTSCTLQALPHTRSQGIAPVALCVADMPMPDCDRHLSRLLPEPELARRRARHSRARHSVILGACQPMCR